jgi:hypothetical protein
MLHSKLFNNRYRTPIVVSGVFILLFIRLLILIDQKSVNILFWDQWDYYTPMFDNMNIWSKVTFQQGSHFMGIGYFLIQVLAEITHWNTRADAFSVLGIICLALVAAIYLKRRLFESFSPWDALLPLIFLTSTQFEIFLGAPDESSAAIPLLLLFLYCHAWITDNRWIKYVSIVVLSYLMVFTGYGYIVAPINLVLLGIDIYQSIRMRIRNDITAPTIALLLSFISVGLFISRFNFNTVGAGCSGIKIADIIKYPIFMSVSYAKFIGVDFTLQRWLAVGIGLILLLIFTVIFIFQGLRLVKGTMHLEKIRTVCTILIGFGLVFGASSSIGRTCLGVSSATSSRYMTLLIPAFVGLYFIALSWKAYGKRPLALLLLLIILICGQLPYGKTDLDNIKYLTEDKASWKTCYLKYEDIDQCNDLTHIQIYPGKAQEFQGKLDYLKKNHLNLYLDESSKD